MPSRKRKSKEGQPPPGFKLRYTLRGHKDEIVAIAWSPDGRTLASVSLGKTIHYIHLKPSAAPTFD
jgi:WD40 repeat protein